MSKKEKKLKINNKNNIIKNISKISENKKNLKKKIFRNKTKIK
jgi:hypothetical protein